jgi:putative tryptophan/tyrosine transport system substrate-binding protein
MAIHIGRRDFIKLLGGAAAAWPCAARAQQPTMPVIGYLDERSPDSLESDEAELGAFRRGLSAAGYVEGRNVAIEYRSADGQHDRLPALATDLVRRRVSIIASFGVPATRAAKAATATIPIVFVIGGDPVQVGLVDSLSRPGGNLTGVTFLGSELQRKRLELLHELVPTATIIAFLVNPTGRFVDTATRDLQAGASILGLQLHVLRASTEHDFEAVFATAAQLQAGGLVISPDRLFISRGEQLALLALRHAVPAIHPTRRFAAAGGLMGYGGSRTDQFRLLGVYTGRILKGEKPADLPVQRATTVELVINLKTAKALGLDVPPSLLARADEVIE